MLLEINNKKIEINTKQKRLCFRKKDETDE